MKQLQFFSEEAYSKALSFSSPSALIARKRNAVYDSVMNNFYAVRDRVKELGLFSSASVDMQESQLGVTLKEASVKAYLNSFAGYIAVETPLTQMTQLITYKDMVTKGTGAVVLPMLGEQKPRKTAENTMTLTQVVSGTIQLGSAVVPGSIMIVLQAGDGGATIIDDRKGNLIAEGGVLAAGSKIDYNTGEMTLNLGSGANFQTGKISYNTDGLAPQKDRIKAREGHYLIKAKVNKFEYEYDIIMDAINSKTVAGSSLAADMKQAVTDEHQEAINNALVDAIVNNYAGTNLTIDLSTFSVQAGQFDSVIRTFKSGLVSVDSALANHCWKIVAATAYVVGSQVGDLFCSMDNDQDWVANNTGFVNGLLGFYKGRAVLRHLAIDPKEAYAVHKTANGELAPTGLGILLPATDLPFVGNFDNLNEIASGIYSVEGASLVTNDLAQKFTVEFPSDWMIVS